MILRAKTTKKSRVSENDQTSVSMNIDSVLGGLDNRNANRRDEDNDDAEDEEREERWRSQSFLVDEFDFTVQRNDQKMQEVMHLDFFSATFYSMRTKVKTKYRLLTSDSSEYFFEALFIIGM